ncbi:MAG TPA: DUF3574 domain-containing protein [Usitatibacter sp.]|nr:DUF3574 domain-containing protein [Usitatibacter sp.]
MRGLAALVLAALLAGCAAFAPMPASRCGAGREEAVSDLLYFGTSKPGGTVSLKEWSDFLWEVVTPRFPNGFTAWQAYGQWKPDEGEVQREVSYVLSIVHGDGESTEAGIRAIVDTYKRRFHQESVLRVSSASCVSF